MKAKELLEIKKKQWSISGAPFIEEEMIEFAIEYAKLMCKSQRVSCLNNSKIVCVSDQSPPEYDDEFDTGDFRFYIFYQSILYAPEPEMI